MAVPARVCHVPNGRILQPLRRKNPTFSPSFRNTQPIYSSSQFSLLAIHQRIPSIFRPKAFNRSPLSSPSRTQANQLTDKQFASVVWGTKEDVFHWNYVCVGEGVAFTDEKGTEVAVVLLGWLGAKTKHLKRYANLYHARGVHAITFVASVTDVVWFDLGRRIQERIERLTDELVSWLSRNDGRERFLIFHAFSNTRWLVIAEEKHLLF